MPRTTTTIQRVDHVTDTWEVPCSTCSTGTVRLPGLVRGPGRSVEERLAAAQCAECQVYTPSVRQRWHALEQQDGRHLWE